MLPVICISFSCHAQGPWTKNKGEAYLQLAGSGIFFKTIRIDGEKIKLNERYSDITLQYYMEYGISNRLEWLLILPYKCLYADKNPPNSVSNPGNATLGLKYLLSGKTWKWSAGIQFAPKTSSFDEKTGFSTGFNAVMVLPYITVGSSTDRWYYFGNIGYAYLDNSYSDFLHVNIETGYKYADKGHLIIAVDTRNILNKEEAFLTDTKQSVFYMDRQNYIGIGLKWNYEFKKDRFGINASVFGGINNNNVALAPSYNSGVYITI